jgi:hypothetical protein
MFSLTPVQPKGSPLSLNPFPPKEAREEEPVPKERFPADSGSKKVLSTALAMHGEDTRQYNAPKRKAIERRMGNLPKE